MARRACRGGHIVLLLNQTNLANYRLRLCCRFAGRSDRQGRLDREQVLGGQLLGEVGNVESEELLGPFLGRVLVSPSMLDGIEEVQGTDEMRFRLLTAGARGQVEVKVVEGTGLRIRMQILHQEIKMSSFGEGLDPCEERSGLHTLALGHRL